MAMFKVKDITQLFRDIGQIHHGISILLYFVTNRGFSVSYDERINRLAKISQNQQLLDILACNSANRPAFNKRSHTFLSDFEKMVY